MLCETLQLDVSRPDVTLTAYVWDYSPKLTQAPRPAVLICPGGSYFYCSDREAEPVALAFMAQGYNAFVLRYATYSEGVQAYPSSLAGLAPKPGRVFPEQLLDIGRAWLALGQHAEAWRVDMERVAVAGFSAGAHNAALYSVYWQDALVAGALGVDPARLRPAACILGYTLSDYTMIEPQGEAEKGLAAAVNIAFLGTAAPSPELLERVSPAKHVGRHCPPTFLWATAGDELVSCRHTLAHASALAKAGVPFEVHVFEKGAHGLSVAGQASAGTPEQTDSRAAGWVALCASWLQQRFALVL